MKDTTRRRTDMHAAVLLFLFSLRELHPELEHQCLHGSCFRLHQLLKLVFPGAEPWYGHDHVITLIGGRFYDIRGEVLADDKWIPFTDQRAFNNAYLWGNPQP